MITLALFEQMVTDQVAGLTRNKDFFLEEAPLQHSGDPASGVWLVTRSGDISGSRKGLNLRTTVDFYVATNNKVQSEAILREIRQYLGEHRCFCELRGSIGGIDYHFENVRLRSVSSPENEGATKNGLIVKMTSAELVYDEIKA